MMSVMEGDNQHNKKTNAVKRKKVNSSNKKKKAAKQSVDATESLPLYIMPDYDDILISSARYRDERELELEKLVFGGDDILDELNKTESRKKSKKKKKPTQGFYLHNEGDDEICEDDDVSREVEEKSKQAKKPVWNDDDDEKYLVSDRIETYRKCHKSVALRRNEKYKEYVQEKFIKVMGNPSWASRTEGDDSNDSDENVNELLQKTANFLAPSSSLPKGTIEISKCEYLNEEGVNHGIIKSLEFHPTSRVALVAGDRCTATLYQVDGKVNPKIQSVHFEGFPIHTAHFTVDGNEIIVGSREYGHYFYYDMIGGKIVKVPWEKKMDQMNVRRFSVSPDGKLIAIYGKYGNIHLVSAKSKEWIGSLKMNGAVYSMAFNRDGSQMYSHGDGGKVYIWDMSSRKCIHRFTDEGCIAGTSLAVSPNQKYLVTGSDCGVVNIYEKSSLLTSCDPRPVKTVMNLTTEVTNLKFNCTSELLAMSSPHKINSLRLVHFPSMSVFSNFPLPNAEYRYIDSFDISLNSGYLAFGNNLGKAYLSRLNHYKNY